MTKFVVLKSVVSSTFDGGFRSSGYEIVEFVETDEPVDIPKDLISKIVNRKAIDMGIRNAVKRH